MRNQAQRPRPVMLWRLADFSWLTNATGEKMNEEQRAKLKARLDSIVERNKARIEELEGSEEQPGAIQRESDSVDQKEEGLQQKQEELSTLRETLLENKNNASESVSAREGAIEEAKAALHGTINEARQELERVKNEIAALQKEQEQRAAELERYEGELAQKTTEWEAQKEKLAEEKEQADRQYQKGELELKGSEDQVATLQSQLEQQKQSLANLHSELFKLKGETSENWKASKLAEMEKEYLLAKETKPALEQLKAKLAELASSAEEAKLKAEIAQGKWREAELDFASKQGKHLELAKKALGLRDKVMELRKQPNAKMDADKAEKEFNKAVDERNDALVAFSEVEEKLCVVKKEAEDAGLEAQLKLAALKGAQEAALTQIEDVAAKFASHSMPLDQSEQASSSNLSSMITMMEEILKIEQGGEETSLTNQPDAQSSEEQADPTWEKLNEIDYLGAGSPDDHGMQH